MVSYLQQAMITILWRETCENVVNIGAGPVETQA